jgi:Ribonuclease G/E
LIDTWKEIKEKATAAALAVERGEEAAVPVPLHREMGQTLTIIRDLFTEKISRLVVYSPQSHQEVINYLQEVAPHLISRVVLYTGKVPIFDKFNVEVDLERFSSERVKLPNGGYLVMQETEALVSVDVNGGTGMLGHSTKQREAILEVNLAAARQIASEIRLRDIGGIIVVDFIDMDNAEDERLVHEEMRKAIQRDRSKVSISEISDFGLMEMTRKRVRSSVTLTIHSTCSNCKGTGRVEALETTLSKIERAIRRLLAEHPEVVELSSDASTWPQVLLRVEPSMLEFLKSWKKKRIVQMGHSLKVWITLKVGMELTRGQFEVALRHNSKKASAEAPHGSQKSLQQEKAVTAPVLGKRVWPKRKRFLS